MKFWIGMGLLSIPVALGSYFLAIGCIELANWLFFNDENKEDDEK